MPNLKISTHKLAETSSSLLESLNLLTNEQNKKRVVKYITQKVWRPYLT